MTPARLTVLALVAALVLLAGISLVRQSHGTDMGKAMAAIVCFILAGGLALTVGIAWRLT